MIDKETAVESLSHQVASCVHLMLASTKTTVAVLKERLIALPTREPLDISVVDDLLAARNPPKIQVSLLSDIGFVLGFDWDFKIAKMIVEAAAPPESPQGSETERQDG